ncbi:GNAT family N-acetyltransferase [Paenibacillus flagellatus]|uniref:N-acetyltransferase n=1 Tax=Paenibacillus flagellatus TaxID=2211139 RepID=A0A2V5KG48_9BACL|nr:GNAT family N-acetyltransferase [Paenibacillus flagellatus]PYI53140.1 N-acetyltransferase [Paenibacillus flagellatus]
MLLETERLVLRPYDRDQLPQLHELLSDPVTMEFWPAPFTTEQTRQWFERNRERYAEGYGRLGVFEKRDDSLIGDAGLQKTDIDGVPEWDLGYIVHANYWGKGYGAEAAAALLQYGLKTLGLPRICANMPVHHTRSQKVAVKLGMVLEKEFMNPKNRNLPTYLYVKENRP